MKSLPDRIATVFEIAFVAVIGPIMASLALSPWGQEAVLESVFGLFVFLMVDATVTLAAIVLLLRLNDRRLVDLGLQRRGLEWELLRGVSFAPVLFLIVWATRESMRLLLPEWVSPENPLLDLIAAPSSALLFLVSSLTAGALREEIQRAFVLLKFEQGLGGPWVGLPLWSLFFGIMHLGQGTDRAVAAAFLGLALGGLYLRRRHLGAPITAHALFNAVVIALTYAGFD